MSKNVLGLMSQIYLTFNNVPIFNGTLVIQLFFVTFAI